MAGYRRNFIAGGCFFFTVNLAERRLHLLTIHIENLRSAFRKVRGKHPFTFCPIIFTRYGRCPKAMPILRCVGG